MDIATKQSEWNQFRANDMGEESYVSMVFFGSNILYIDRLLVLEGVFLDELERGKREPDVPQDQRLRIVQAGQMDALSKIMIMMELMFVAIGVFKDDKKELFSKLQEYRGGDVWKVVNDILDGNLSISEYWKIMGFPELKRLCLTRQELSWVEKMFNGVLDEFAEIIKWLAKFYEQHSRLYNKFKHGLLIRFGYEKRIPVAGPQHLLIAFDMHARPKRKRRTVIPIHRTTFTSKQRVVVSKSDDSVWDKYSKAMSYTRKVVLFMAKNNMVRLQNCNENFVPYDFNTEGEKELLHFPNTLTDQEIRYLEPIVQKLDKETLYIEDKVPDYGTLDSVTITEVIHRLVSEDVVEVE